MTTKTKPRNLSGEEFDEAVLRGRLHARAGYSIYSNPYDPEQQTNLWHVWRFAYADAAGPDSE